MQSAYDRWLTSDRAYERYHGLDGDDEDRELAEEWRDEERRELDEEKKSRKRL